MRRSQTRGARRAVKLPMSVPVHCDLMRPATERLGELLEQADVRAPRIPVVNNADIAVRNQPDEIRDALKRQLYQPVRWVETIRTLSNMGATRIIECGPGKVLTGLMKRIDRDLRAVALNDSNAIDIALKESGENS